MRTRSGRFALVALLFGACAAPPRGELGPAAAPAARDQRAGEVLGYLATASGHRSAAVGLIDLARRTQNPVSDLLSVGLDANASTGVGLDDDLQYVFNLRAAVPVRLNAGWNLVARATLPAIYQPETVPGRGDDFGMGDMTLTTFISPAKPDGAAWGVGPVFLLPTSTGRQLGPGEWGVGASAVGLATRGPWVYGALIQNVWGFDGSGDAMLLQPFVNYNFGAGWYVVSAPVLTANFEANDQDTWTVPVGGGVGKIVRVGQQPVNIRAQAFYNVERPAGGPEWTFELEIQLLFP